MASRYVLHNARRFQRSSDTSSFLLKNLPKRQRKLSYEVSFEAIKEFLCRKKLCDKNVKKNTKISLQKSFSLFPRMLSVLRSLFLHFIIFDKSKPNLTQMQPISSFDGVIQDILMHQEKQLFGWTKTTCCTQGTLSSKIHLLKKDLPQNGYPENLITETVEKCQIPKTTTETEIHTNPMVLPYLKRFFEESVTNIQNYFQISQNITKHPNKNRARQLRNLK